MFLNAWFPESCKIILTFINISKGLKQPLFLVKLLIVNKLGALPLFNIWKRACARIFKSIEFCKLLVYLLSMFS